MPILQSNFDAVSSDQCVVSETECVSQDRHETFVSGDFLAVKIQIPEDEDVDTFPVNGKWLGFGHAAIAKFSPQSIIGITLCLPVV